MNKTGRILCLVGFMFMSAISTFGQPYAYLEDGPADRRGLPFLSPNAVENRYAVYRMGDKTVEVFFVYADVWMGENWEPVALERGRTGFRRSKDEYTIVRVDNEGFRVFTVFRHGESGDVILNFVNALLKRIDTFLSRPEDVTELPFPAILRDE